MTPEQSAVIAACRARYPSVRSVETVVVVIVEDTDGRETRLTVAHDGTTRMGGGYVPTRLYGGLPSSNEARREWGTGLPKHASGQMETDR